jgi:hypothetical protein
VVTRDGAVRLAVKFVLWSVPGSGLKLDRELAPDSGSDGEPDCSGSDLVNQGALRATKVTTCRRTSWESAHILDRRRILHKATYQKTHWTQVKQLHRFA